MRDSNGAELVEREILGETVTIVKDDPETGEWILSKCSWEIEQ